MADTSKCTVYCKLDRPCIVEDLVNIFNNLDETKVSNYPPYLPNPSDLFVFKREAKFENEIWEEDGYDWMKCGCVIFPKKQPILLRTSFSLKSSQKSSLFSGSSQSEMSHFSRHVYARIDEPFIIIVHYVCTKEEINSYLLSNCFDHEYAMMKRSQPAYSEMEGIPVHESSGNIDVKKVFGHHGTTYVNDHDRETGKYDGAAEALADCVKTKYVHDASALDCTHEKIEVIDLDLETVEIDGAPQLSPYSVQNVQQGKPILKEHSAIENLSDTIVYRHSALPLKNQEALDILRNVEANKISKFPPECPKSGEIYVYKYCTEYEAENSWKDKNRWTFRGTTTFPPIKSLMRKHCWQSYGAAYESKFYRQKYVLLSDTLTVLIHYFKDLPFLTHKMAAPSSGVCTSVLKTSIDEDVNNASALDRPHEKIEAIDFDPETEKIDGVAQASAHSVISQQLCFFIEAPAPEKPSETIVYGHSPVHLTFSEVYSILSKVDATKISKLPPQCPKSGEVYVYVYDDEYEAGNAWKDKKYCWKNLGINKIPASKPLIRKHYWKSHGADGTSFCRQKYALLSNALTVLVHYFGDQSAGKKECSSVLKAQRNKGANDASALDCSLEKIGAHQTSADSIQNMEQHIFKEYPAPENSSETIVYGHSPVHLTTSQAYSILSNVDATKISKLPPQCPKSGEFYVYVFDTEEEARKLWKDRRYCWRNVGLKLKPRKNPIISKCCWQSCGANSKSSFYRQKYVLLSDSLSVLIHYFGDQSAGEGNGNGKHVRRIPQKTKSLSSLMSQDVTNFFTEHSPPDIPSETIVYGDLIRPLGRRISLHPIAKHIFANFDKAKVSKTPPFRPKGGQMYLYKFDSEIEADDWKSDGYLWMNIGYSKLPRRNPVMKRFYHHIRLSTGKKKFLKKSKNFARMAFQPLNDKLTVLVVYCGDESLFVPLKHGHNRKSDCEFIATRKSTLRKMRQLTSSMIPSEVASLMTFGNQDSSNLRNIDQIRNARHKWLSQQVRDNARQPRLLSATGTCLSTR